MLDDDTLMKKYMGNRKAFIKKEEDRDDESDPNKNINELKKKTDESKNRVFKMKNDIMEIQTPNAMPNSKRLNMHIFL